MNQVLDKKLSSIYRWNNAVEPNTIGIEIEVEGRNLPAIFGKWLLHDDGSLRGEASAEYVLRKPLPRHEVSGALKYLTQCFRDNETEVDAESDRTSVHIHFNMRDKTMREIYTFWTVWCIVEDLSYELCGPERRGNLFCMRLMDCESMIEGARNDLNPKVKDSYKSQYFHGDNYRYAGCNMASLKKFGSVEFRGMHGTIDFDEIETWIDFLQSIILAAAKYKDPQQVIERFSHLGVDRWLRSLELSYRIQRQLLEAPNARRMLWDGMRLAQDIAWILPSWDTEKVEEKSEVREELNIIDEDGPLNFNFQEFGEAEEFNEPRVVFNTPEPPPPQPQPEAPRPGPRFEWHRMNEEIIRRAVTEDDLRPPRPVRPAVVPGRPLRRRRAQRRQNNEGL